MAKNINELECLIIDLLQSKGFIRNEIEAYLKKEVYQLHPNEVLKIKNYATHFGIKAKEKLIEEILELRREALIARLSEQ